MTPPAELWGFTGWLDAHNGAVAAGAIVVLVLVTIAYVALTRSQLSELRRERGEANRPHLAWQITALAPTRTATATIRVVNNSRAAAYHAILCAVEANGKWVKTIPLDLGPGDDSGSVPGTPQTEAPPSPEVLGGPLPRRAAFCQNQFGQVFRFRMDVMPGDTWKRRRWWQFWRRTPPWVTWYTSALRGHPGWF
jgi:hypothetical protein